MFKHTRPAGSGRKSVPIETRFRKFFVQGGPDECWLWTGSRNTENRKGNGHGRIRNMETGGNSLAHRLAYELHYGPIPSGVQVLHTCDVPHCVNPAHLFLGSQPDNIHDMYAKGRGPDVGGEKNPRAVLTEDDVRLIREMVSNGAGIRATARLFNVTPPLIRYIRDRKIWAEIC